MCCSVVATCVSGCGVYTECRAAAAGLSGHRARRRVVDSRGTVLVAGLSLNK
jgi:hypothetical protein